MNYKPEHDDEPGHDEEPGPDKDDDEPGLDKEAGPNYDDEPEPKYDDGSWPTSRRKSTEEFVANFEEEEHRELLRRLTDDAANSTSVGAEETANGTASWPPTTRSTLEFMEQERRAMARRRGHRRRGKPLQFMALETNR